MDYMSKKITKCKVLLMASVIMLMLLCMPYAASAAEYTVNSASDFEKYWNTGSGMIVLNSDISLEGEYDLDDSDDITIDLKGHNIKGSGTSSDYIFHVEDSASLTIDDSVGGGIIQAITDEDYENVIYVEDSGSFTLSGGNIKGNGNKDDDCRLVFVEDDYAKFTMEGGKLSDNKYDGGGAAVYIDEGSFYMSGGEICYNEAYKGELSIFTYGEGAVYYDGDDDSEFVMSGGEIHHNKAMQGGGIYIDDWKVTLKGGKIHHNVAIEGGGVYASTHCDGVELSGSLEITENTATYRRENATTDSVSGGGIYFYRFDDLFTESMVYFGGSVKICNNSPSDCMMFYDDDYIEVMDDIDTTPENHAWVGLSGQWAYYQADDMINIKNKDAAVCFFGVDVPHANYYVRAEEQKDGKYALALRSGDNRADSENYIDSKYMTMMDFNEYSMRDKTGKPILEGDYTCSYDPIYLTYTINTSKGVYVDDISHFLKSERKEFTDADFVKDEITRTDDVTTHTVYYLCKNKTKFNNSNLAIARDVYYKVIINIDNHKVGFDLNDHGNQIDPQIIEDGERAKKPADPEAEGYTFEGWYKEAACKNPIDFYDVITEDLTCYAKWSSETSPESYSYTVDFNMNGHGVQVPYQTVDKGDKVNRPEDPTDDEWKFMGWYSDEALENEFDFSSKIKKDTTIYAKWKEKDRYQVTFEMNGHGDQIPYQTVIEGDKAAIPTDPSEEGWEFDGWYGDEELSQEFDFNNAIKENTKVFAKWTSEAPEPATYHTLSFEMNGHGEQVPYQVVEVDDVTMEPDTPEDEVFDFRGWYTDNTYETEFKFGEKLTEDTVVYAGWAQIGPPPIQEDVTVRFVMNGHGDQVPYQIVKQGEKADKPDEASDYGWRFMGWYTDESLENEYDFTSDSCFVFSDTTLYAKWEPKEFVLDISGEKYPQINGTKYDLPDDPVKEGYVFDGWQLDYGDSTVIIDRDTIAKGEGELKAEALWKEKEIASFEPPEARNGLTYDGSEQMLIKEGRTEDGAFKYVVSKSSDTPETGWNDSPAKMKDAGTYYVHYYVEGDDRHQSSEPSYVEVQIGKASPKLVYPEAIEGLEYTGEAQQLINEGSSEFGKISYALATSTDDTEYEWTENVREIKGTDAGTYYVHYRAPGDDNHLAIEDDCIEVTIIMPEYTVSFDTDGGTKVKDQIVEFGKTVTKPSNPEKDGYYFVGWYKDSLMLSEFDFSTEIKSDTTVYAKFKARKDIGKAKISVQKKHIYNGKVHKPKVTVKYGSTTLVKGTDYKVKYDSGCKSVGTYKITITGIGKYKGTVNTSHYISPNYSYIRSLKGSKKAFTVTWKKQTKKMSTSHVTGYQICYSTKSSMSDSKKIKVKGYTKTSKKISKLKAGKKYYVKVRTYKVVNGKTYYSAWSKKKSVKTK